MKNRSIRTAAIVLITTALFAASFLWPFDNIGIANAEDELTYHEDVEDAVAEMREAMKERETEVTIGIIGTTDQDGLRQSISELLDRATEHTGKPDEGDYINFQYASYKGEARTTHSGALPAIEIKYDLSYYDNAEQEAAVSAKIDEILDGLDLERKTDYEKVEAIHEYLCKNVKYEEAESSDDVRRTAYGALVEGRAVCQGYCVALYRLLLEAGVDNRVIFGNGVGPNGESAAHTWNIVDLYGDYYYVDITWDDAAGTEEYFLIPAGAGFEDEHIPGEEYDENFFTEKYPVASEAFAGDVMGSFDKIMWAAQDLEAAVLSIAAEEA